MSAYAVYIHYCYLILARLYNALMLLLYIKKQLLKAVTGNDFKSSFNFLFPFNYFMLNFLFKSVSYIQKFNFGIQSLSHFNSKCLGFVEVWQSLLVEGLANKHFFLPIFSVFLTSLSVGCGD